MIGFLRGRDWLCDLVPRFWGRMLKIFRTGPGQSQTVLRFGFDPGTDVFKFCCVFWYHSDSLTNETKNG